MMKKRTTSQFNIIRMRTKEENFFAEEIHIDTISLRGAN
jgi:hypothetical protein